MYESSLYSIGMVTRQLDDNLVLAMENKVNDSFAFVSNGAMDINHCYLSQRLLHSPHYNTPVTITALINYHFLASRHPHTLTASDTPLFLFN